MGKGRILIVDDQPDHIFSRRQKLEAEGYEVKEAYDAATALREFETGLIHLGIVDLRLVNPKDDNDWSGRDLAREIHRQDPQFPCIILTDYATYLAVQDARRPDEQGLPVAVDFVAKDEGLPQLIDAVNLQFQMRVKINASLRVEFGGPLSCICIANMIEFGRKAVEHEAQTNQLLLQSQEILDLLCKIFFDRDRIIIYPLVSGRSNAAVLAIRPFTDGHADRVVIAKLGKRAEIEREAINYRKHAEDFAETWAPALKRHSSATEPTATTLHYGGLVYSVAGEGFEWTERFRDFYRGNEPDKIIRVLGNFLTKMRQGWYTLPKRDKEKTMSTAYREELELTSAHHSRAEFVETVRRLSDEIKDFGLELDIKEEKPTFNFKGLSPSPYPDPTAYVYDDVKDFGHMLHCPTHGDFNGDNLLVDKKHGYIWLIDFAKTGEGSAVRDFAELESAIKFEMIEETDLSSLYHFERKLLEGKTLEDTPEPDPDMPPDLRKAMLVIKTLRKQVPKVASLADYFVGLLFHAAWMVVSEGSSPPSVGQTRPVSVRKIHALLSASMLCDWLERGEPPPAGLSATPTLLKPTIATGITHLASAPSVAAVRLRNYASQTVTATVHWEIQDFPSSVYNSTVVLKPDETFSCDYQPHFTPYELRSVHERRHARLNVQVSQSRGSQDQTILNHSFDVVLLPRNVMLWQERDAEGQTRDISHYVGAWVTPEIKAVAELQRGILEKHAHRIMAGYQGGNTQEERDMIVREQIRAIYNYLKHVLNMAYANTAITFGSHPENSQVVRLPNETVKVNRGTANCIDATVLFASLIERFGMNPVIVLVPGHAFLGWQAWHNSAKHEYLETTVIDQMDFDDAAKLGQAQWQKANTEGVLREWSLWRLREEGIDPMPMEED